MVILTHNQYVDKYILTHIIAYNLYNKMKIFMKIIFTQVTRPEQYFVSELEDEPRRRVVINRSF